MASLNPEPVDHRPDPSSIDLCQRHLAQRRRADHRSKHRTFRPSGLHCIWGKPCGEHISLRPLFFSLSLTIPLSPSSPSSSSSSSFFLFLLSLTHAQPFILYVTLTLISTILSTQTTANPDAMELTWSIVTALPHQQSNSRTICRELLRILSRTSLTLTKQSQYNIRSSPLCIPAIQTAASSTSLRIRSLVLTPLTLRS